MRIKTQFSGVRRASRTDSAVNICMMYSSLYLRDAAISEELDAGHYFKFS